MDPIEDNFDLYLGYRIPDDLRRLYNNDVYRHFPTPREEWNRRHILVPP